MPSDPRPAVRLIRGQNLPLDAPRVVVGASSAVPVDVSALLVTAELRVRSDADLVFFNAPSAGGVRWSDESGEQRIEADLARVPADVHAVLVAVSLAGGGTFGAVAAPPLLRLATADGEQVIATFEADGLEAERAIIGVELYRRGEGWKVRAVGQGYAGGLPELVTAHGVEVDDPGEPTAEPPGKGPGFGVPGPAATKPLPRPVAMSSTPASGPAAGPETVPAEPAAAGTAPPAAAGPASVPGASSATGSATGSGSGVGMGTGPGRGTDSGVGLGAAPEGADPNEVGYVERVWLVWEDASRSIAAFRAATEHALTIRDDEIAGRATPGRYERLREAAAARLADDMRQLKDELAGAEEEATAEAVPFSSTTWLTWRPRNDLAEGVLIGHLDADAAPELRVPLILRLPWRRAVWINSGALPGDAAAFAWSLATRFLAAVPPGTTGIEVIDPSGLSGAGWIDGLDPLAVERVLGGGVAAGPAAGERIRTLLDLADLRQIGGADDVNDPSGPWAGGPPVRLVLVFDAATALEDPGDGDRLARLVEDGPPSGLPVILIDSGEPATESVRTLRVRQACHNLPSAEDVIHDPWVAVDWTLVPDVLPDAAEATRAPALPAHVAVTHARTVAGA